MTAHRLRPRRRRRAGRCGCLHGVLFVRGEVDLATAPDITELLRGDRAVCVVDLSGVTFIDAAGLAHLRDGIARATHRIAVRAPSEAVRRLLTVAGLDPADLVTTWRSPRSHAVGSSGIVRLVAGRRHLPGVRW